MVSLPKPKGSQTKRKISDPSEGNSAKLLTATLPEVCSAQDPSLGTLI